MVGQAPSGVVTIKPCLDPDQAQRDAGPIIVDLKILCVEPGFISVERKRNFAGHFNNRFETMAAGELEAVLALKGIEALRTSAHIEVTRDNQWIDRIADPVEEIG